MKRLLVNERLDPGAPAMPDFSAYSESMTETTIDPPEATRTSATADALVLARKSLLSAVDVRSLQTVAAAFLRRNSNAALVAWYYPAGGKIGQTDRIEGLLCPTEGIAESLRSAMCDTARLANQTTEPRAVQVTGQAASAFQLVAIPIPAFSGQCLLALLEPETDEAAVSSTTWSTLMLLSSLMTEWALQQRCANAANDARSVATLIELIAHVQAATDTNAACQRLADSLQKLLNADQVFIGLCRSGSRDCKLTAIAGGGTIDPFSEDTRLIESVLQESQLRSAGGTWPVRDPDNRHALLSHQQLSELWNACAVVSTPLQSETGIATGAILLTFRDTEKTADIATAEQFLRAAAGSLNSCMEILQKLADSRWLKWAKSFRKLFSRSRLELAGWVCVVIAAALMIPVDYTVHGTSELQPVERRFVAAPFNGPLLKCLVEPGDIVERDQLLATLDGREIRWELAEVQANLHKATKERNTHMSSREFGEAAIALHEIQRLQQRAELLTHRDTSLEIRSPANGVVVSGDHREAEGVPLEMGQTLFEIAPLDAMVVEVCIPEVDIRHVRVGMKVRVQLDAVPEDSVEATIRSIHPRAELRDGDNVFVAEADIVNSSGLLRPGMRGSSRVSTGRHLLGWNLFHKPVAWMLGWLGL
ncbi:MAG TPA: efflux RND transporter periplasmic adaptor subunit [Planctomycetaceae bacterium]|nr:efflux RND transporter periplasmic adaptor subunit [Planctomycetaceae bacterium]